jgi:hypothetical protein
VLKGFFKTRLENIFFYIKMGHKIKIRNIGRWSLLASYLGNNKGYNKLVCVNVVRIFFEEFEVQRCQEVFFLFFVCGAFLFQPILMNLFSL